jgi:uncharacterized protein YndB with AHSA1/START domain
VSTPDITPDHVSTVTFPDDLEIVITRDFDASKQLVFDVLTKTEHLRKTLAPYDEVLTECVFDVRVSGEYRYTFVTPDGVECSFWGTFLEVDEPDHISETWFFGGWSDAEAVETFDLVEHEGVTTMRWSLRFTDLAGRSHMQKFDGVQANFDNVEAYLKELLAAA